MLPSDRELTTQRIPLRCMWAPSAGTVLRILRQTCRETLVECKGSTGHLGLIELELPPQGRSSKPRILGAGRYTAFFTGFSMEDTLTLGKHLGKVTGMGSQLLG